MKSDQGAALSISPAQVELFVREQVLAALPSHTLRAIARQQLRKQLGQLTLKEAARWLRWRSPESLRRALKRKGIDKISGCPDLTYAVPDLVRFREMHRVKGHVRSKKIVPMHARHAA
jgi:hypothetical protein